MNNKKKNSPPGLYIIDKTVVGRRRSCRSLEAPVVSSLSAMVTAGASGLCVRPRYVAMLVLAALVLVVRCEEENVSEVLRTLKAQVDGLLERRQEDFRVLEETIRQSVDKSAEVVALKKEMEKLR